MIPRQSFDYMYIEPLPTFYSIIVYQHNYDAMFMRTSDDWSCQLLYGGWLLVARELWYVLSTVRWKPVTI